MASGGARAGAGRKSRAEKFARPIAAAEKRIADRLPGLIDSLFELAEGVKVEGMDMEGNVSVYTKPPDFKSCEYLVNRILGKPTEQIEAEVSGPGGGPIAIREVVIERPVAADGNG